MNAAQKWDMLSSQFDTHGNNELFHGAADNIYTAWPVILSYIKKNTNIRKNNPRALDYGCGTGMFCKELASLGFKAFGIDISSKMIAIAKKHSKDKTKYYMGNFDDVDKISKKAGKFDVMASIMAFQFVPDIEKCARKLADS